MYRDIFSINLANFLLSFSDAMDMANASVASHQMRTSFICIEMGKAANLSESDIRKIFIAAIIHDIGALSPEEKLAIHNFDFEKLNPELHCRVGALLFQGVPYLRASKHIVRFHHKDFKDWKEGSDNPIIFESQILYLADYLERLINREQYILSQSKHLISEICALSGTKIHPHVVELFVEVAKREDFWLDLVSPRLYSLLLNNGPCQNMLIDSSNLYSMFQLFRKIIDFRSKYTATHSSSVSKCAATLAKIFGLTDKEVEFARIAGDLHDVGKLLISDSVLYKTSKLNEAEYQIMKQHSYHTYSILTTIKGFGYVSEWAAFHHERLDGSGYPFHHDDSKLTIGARILAVSDIFTSLNENRPYRKAMEKKDIVGILKDYSKRYFLDKKIVNMLLENYGDIASLVDSMQFDIKEEVQHFLAFN